MRAPSPRQAPANQSRGFESGNKYEENVKEKHIFVKRGISKLTLFPVETHWYFKLYISPILLQSLHFYLVSLGTYEIILYHGGKGG